MDDLVNTLAVVLVESPNGKFADEIKRLLRLSDSEITLFMQTTSPEETKQDRAKTLIRSVPNCTLRARFGHYLEPK